MRVCKRRWKISQLDECNHKTLQDVSTMKSTDALLLKIENTKAFSCIVLSDDRTAASVLFPEHQEKLQRFKDITSVHGYSDLLNIYALEKTKKLIVFIDVTSRDPVPELKEMIYSIHAEGRGLFFGFTFGSFSDRDFERLISVGFDEVFELGDNDKKKYVRMYSWMRRFGGNPILARNAEKDAITYLSNKKNKRVGKWTIIASEMSALDDEGQKVKLTRQEIDFLTLLFEEAKSIRSTSYEELFKAPHAIVNKLRKKLGENLPIQHDSGGRYHLLKDVQ
jgi:hypothetical protein